MCPVESSPNYQSVKIKKKNILRERSKNTPPNPKSLIDLDEIPEQYRRTFSNDNFLLCDSKAHGEVPTGRVLVFCTRRNLEILRECDVWYVDGTFKVAPTIFTQLFTVLGNVPAIVGNDDCLKVPLPLAYALLSSKEEEQYTAVFEALSSAADEYGIRDFEPRFVMSDFELGIVNAVFLAFNNCDIELCFFHLKQSEYRHIQELGLQVAYCNPDDSTVRDFCHMLAALAYVPVRHVKAAFVALKDVAPEIPKIPDLIEYFGVTYVVGVPGAGRRRAVPPRYCPKLWNIYEATLEGRAATNNASEGWHNRFAHLVDRKHPDLHSLLNHLKKEQGDTEISILELRMGRKIKAAPRKKWAQHHERVRTTVRSFETFGMPRIVEYLELVSQHVSLV